MSSLYLIRGLPGSGKSALAKSLTVSGACHFEADQYFMRGGVYSFDKTKLQQAHDSCLANTRSALLSNSSAIVSNTFTTAQELEPYIDLANKLNTEGFCEYEYDIKVYLLTAGMSMPNVHDVPVESIVRMLKRWQDVTLSYSDGLYKLGL